MFPRRERDKVGPSTSAKLSADESQAGTAGLQKTHAANTARFYGKDPNGAKNSPNPHAYPKSNPLKP